MKIYMAPMEGITGYTYRNIYRSFYEDADRYFTPFISAHKKLGKKVINEIAQENNQGIELVPQIMVNNAAEACELEALLKPYGYYELNLNTGCPSGTVTGKNRGAGLLRDKYALEVLFEELFSRVSVPLSLKTRIGWEHVEEWLELSKIIGRYPFSEVIIHSRVRQEFYLGSAHREAMTIAAENISAPIIYNGDIFTVEDAGKLIQDYPWISGIMVGRGVLQNPGLIEQLKHMTDEEEHIAEDKAYTNRRIYDFVTGLYNCYYELFGSEINTLYHMKEIWSFMGNNYAENERELKIIRKTRSVQEYKCAVSSILLGE